MRKKVVFDDSSSEEDSLSDQLFQSKERSPTKKGSQSLKENATPSMSKKTLFSSSSDDDDDNVGFSTVKKKENNGSTGLSINKAYATKYNEVKRAKELHTLTSKYGKRVKLEEGEYSDEEDEEDDDAVLLTKEREIAFAKALYAVRHPEEPITENFFSSPEQQEAYNAQMFKEAMKKKRSKGKERFLSDEYQRAVLASASGNLLDETETVENTSGSKKLVPRNEKEKALRDAFLKSAEEVEDFSVHPKESIKRDNEDKKGDEEDDRERAEARRLVEKAMSSTGEESLNEEEVFLKNFFVNELWKREKNSDGNTIDFQSLAEAEELEAFYEEAEEWEHKFQEKKYRHEEEMEAASHVMTYPRPIGEAAEGLLRKQDTSRRDARQRRRERIVEARLRQVEELKRLKHLQKQEINKQRALIASVAGLINRNGRKHGGIANDDKGGKPHLNYNGSEKATRDLSQSEQEQEDEEEEKQLTRLKQVWSEKDFDAPFDPVEFDKKMSMIFNDEYYDERNVDENEIEFMEAELDELDDTLGDLKKEDGEKDGKKGSHKKNESFSHRQKKKELLEELWETPDLFLAESLEEAKRQSNSPMTSRGSADSSPFMPLTNDMEEFSSTSAFSLLYPTSSLPHVAEEHYRNGMEGELVKGNANHYDTLEGEAHDRTLGQTASENEVLEKLQKGLKEKEDAYYRLHQENATTLPFRYREVPPESFSLSVEEILARDDRQLNMIAPMNCYAAYLDKGSNERDRRRIENRRRRGFRELESTRRSRRYGEVRKTAILDESITEEDGRKIAERLRSRLQGEGKEALETKEEENYADKNYYRTHKRFSTLSYSDIKHNNSLSPSTKRPKMDFGTCERGKK